ncbi:MAG TPA: hypothetical protein VFW68_02845 [Rhodocyclaceae bacterium]|nr:hypothetical protein [Rhodocyclaceae bacterium]
MPNTPDRAAFWREFICSKCHYPEPAILRAQFSVAELSEFCDCGCNSFKVRVSPTAGIAPIAKPGKYGTVFEVNFKLSEEERTLEIILFADEKGNLSYVEIDCCANSYPVPERISVVEPPYYIYANVSRAL